MSGPKHYNITLNILTDDQLTHRYERSNVAWINIGTYRPCACMELIASRKGCHIILFGFIFKYGYFKDRKLDYLMCYELYRLFVCLFNETRTFFISYTIFTACCNSAPLKHAIIYK